MLALQGCADSLDSSGPVDRPVTWTAASAAEDSSARVVRHFEPLHEGEAWELDAPEVSVLSVPEESDADELVDVLFLGAEEEDTLVRAERAGELDPSRFNRVRVVHGISGAAAMSAVFLRDGETVARTDWIGLAQVPGLQSTSFDVPSELESGPHPDALSIEVRGGPLLLQLRSVALVDRPPELALPDPEEGPQLVTLGGESRIGVGVSTRGGLSAPALPGPETELHFAWSPFDAPDLDSAEAELVLRAVAGGEVVLEERRSFAPPRPGSGAESAGDGALAWREVSVPLGARAGEALELRLDVEAPGEAMCAVAEAWLREPARDRAPGDRPPRTVLLVTSDTHRGDHLGVAHSGVRIETPALDRLAGRGVLFEDCYTWANVTVPSHVALMTGRHPRDTGVRDNRVRLRRTATTLAEVFHDRGWTTWAAVSARHLGDDVSGLGQGFERVSVPEGRDRPAKETVERVLDWLPAPATTPLFVWVHVFDAHWPYEPPRAWEERYVADLDPAGSVPVPAGVRGESMEGVTDLRMPLMEYRAEISYLDEELGRLFELPRFRGGLVAVVGDHGESLGANGLWFNHVGLTPGTLHVPLIVAWPAAPAGTRIARRSPQAHLGRTLLDLAGLEDAPFPGRDLLDDAALDRPPGPLFALHAGGTAASITVGRDHLVLQLRDYRNLPSRPRRDRHEVELYDVVADPSCEHDRVAEEPERARELRAALIRWLSRPEPLGWNRTATIDAAMDEELRQLGYAGGTEPAGDLWIEDDCEHCRAFRR